MNPRQLRLLAVEDADAEVAVLRTRLEAAGFAVDASRARTADEMREALDRHRFDLVVSDDRLEAFSALDALRVAQASGLDLPFLIVSSQPGEERAIELMHAGAHDYVSKERLGRLVPAVERELREAHERRERRRAEQALRASEQRYRLAGGIAHELNNLLMAVTGYSELLLDRLDSRDPLRSNAEDIRNAATRAAGLTRELLTFSRKQVLRPTVIDVNAVVADLERLLRRLIGEDVLFSTAFAPDPAPVLADRGQIEQVIMNLVVNARDAMPSGGELHLATRRFTLELPDAAGYPRLEPGEYVSLEVRDTGTGMTEDVLAQVFEPFFTTKEPGKGTGLGLSTAHGVVAQSGGRITVQSTPGHGTTFRVLLPVATVATTRPPVRGGLSAIPRGTETVLLVEDDAGVRDLIRDFLVRWGYTVVDAPDPSHAFDRFEEHEGRLQLLITDVVMPQMNGRELAEALVARQPDLRVLFMSGYTDDHVLAHGVAGGAGFLHKPFTPDVLARKVREVLDGGDARHR
jgi:two-component system cell cycle sensor histidine kinase/response regulator CckA